MARHRRSFHVHVHQRSEDPSYFAWSVSRTLWAPLNQARSAEFARGTLELTVGEADPRWSALTCLEIACAEYRRQLEAEKPEDHP